MREELIKWACEVFGEMNIGDDFDLRGNTTRDKKGSPVNHITMFVKKKKGIQQEWLKKETFMRWAEELKAIVGDHLSFKLSVSEGNQMKYARAYIKSEGKHEEVEANYYNYQFNLDVIKKH